MNIQNEVLKAYSSYITGTDGGCSVVDDEVFAAYLDFTFRHKISPMVFTHLISAGKLNLSDENFKQLKSFTVRQAVIQTEKNVEFLRIYNRLTSAGFTPLCVKGVICGAFYPTPDLRASNDGDLLVKQEEFEACAKELIKCGYVADCEDFNACEIGLKNPKTGCLIELHKSLFPDNTVYKKFNNLLGDIFEKYQTVKIDSVNIFTPSVNKHFLYLILHSFKHFLIGGFGIRQVSDISLFCKNCNIDWDYIFLSCSQLNITDFLSALLKIGSDFFELDLSSVNSELFNEVIDYELLLDDIMKSGIYGSSTVERKHSGNVTFGKYSESFGEKKKSALFPPREYMKKNYPKVAQSAIYLPFAWADRIIKYSKSRNNTANTLDIAGERIAIFKKYNIIK